MGDAQSKPMSLGNLNKTDVEKIRKKFRLKENNGKMSTLDFMYGYPCILRPYIALILPSLYEMFKKKGKRVEKPPPLGINYAFSMIFKKGSKKFKNEISLQDIVSILSYLVTGKTETIVNILCTSFLAYSKEMHNVGKGKECESTYVSNEENKDGRDKNEKRENVEADNTINEVNASTNIEQNMNTDKPENNFDEDEDGEKNNCKIIKNRSSQMKLKTVLSDSNIDEMNKSIKKERSYKFIKNNVYMLDKQVVNCDIGKFYNAKDLMEIEESLHHLFTYMYIEQLYLLCPSNKLFQLSNKKLSSSDKDNLFSRSNTNLCKEFLLKRKNSWDMTFFFPDLYCSLETDLDFRNILSGFRLYVSSKESSKLSLYCLAVDYISSTFLGLSANYAEATFRHFTDTENVLYTTEKKEGEEFINGIASEENTNEELNNICLTSFELIHSIYTNMKKNELKNQESSEEAILKKEWEKSYTKSSSVLEIQTKTNGWRGLFLNKTSKILTDEIVFALRQCSTIFTNNEWFRLYASWKQGTSFNRFISSFLFYPSPIVIVIKTIDNQILGAVSTTPLKDSHLFHGSSADFLFSASPIFRIIKTNGLGNNYAYLNSKNSFYPKGVGFGGKTECFRFFLSDEFKESYCTQSDYTYESGRLYFPHQKKRGSSLNKNNNKSGSGIIFNGNNENITEANKTEIKNTKENDIKGDNHGTYNTREYIINDFSTSKHINCSKKEETGYDNDDEDDDDDDDEEEEVYGFLCKLHIDEVEVWGCGDTRALEEQRAMVQNEESCKNERRSVDKSKMVQNSFDKEFLLPKMFVGKMEEIAPDT